MILLGERIEHALTQESREPAAKLSAPALEVVGAKLVDHEVDDQSGRIGYRSRRRMPELDDDRIEDQ